MSHPSLAIWNGNNENFMGWFEWDWPRQLDGRPWGSHFYLDLLPWPRRRTRSRPPVLAGKSRTRGRCRSTPTDDRHGCRHLWDVWNQVDYRRTATHVPRFVAEFGWQAPATRATIDRWISDDPLLPDSPAMLHHQKALDGQGKLSRGCGAVLPSSRPTPMSGCGRCNSIRRGRSRPASSTSAPTAAPAWAPLWWQFNDCWPVTSWAVLDSDGRRKPAFYALQAAYATDLLTIQPRRADDLVVAAVNDGGEVWSGSLRIRRMRFDGTVLSEAAVIHVDVPARSVGTTHSCRPRRCSRRSGGRVAGRRARRVDGRSGSSFPIGSFHRSRPCSTSTSSPTTRRPMITACD